ncbi:MAG: 3,4-dihydroxy-2-butanone-4-phosphate synthase [Gammaproteobacteria bacterium AqS3]|nr:3,4-dihydroxy-2-butanone-4-phosphate synthase [Gammaproteobacteria bacterium AqS3]
MVILMDDEDRENEGDLLIAAQHITPDAINFMARYARGLICLTLTEEHARRLGLDLMERKNTSQYGTRFTVSIEAARGVTTGISAADRARTIQVAVADGAGPGDIATPGHIFPVVAQAGGVLNRAGHTEAGCDLVRMAGLTPAGVIAEIMNEDGTMARLPDLEMFAQHHGLRLGTIADLIEYRLVNERTVYMESERPVATPHGDFRLCSFRDEITGEMHLAMAHGEIDTGEPVLVRVMQRNTLGDILDIEQAGRWSAGASLRAIVEHGRGVLVLIGHSETPDQVRWGLRRLDGEGGAEPAPEPAADAGSDDEVPVSYRVIGAGSQVLRSLGVRRMELLSSPVRFRSISGYNLEVVGFREPPG